MSEFKIPYPIQTTKVIIKAENKLESYLNLDIPDNHTITLVELRQFYKNYLEQQKYFNGLKANWSKSHTKIKTQTASAINNTHLYFLTHYISTLARPSRQLYIVFRHFRLALRHFHDPKQQNYFLQHHFHQFFKRFPQKPSCKTHHTSLTIS